MFTSDNRDDFDNDLFLGNREPFSSEQDQRETLYNHHYHHQLSLFDPFSSGQDQRETQHNHHYHHQLSLFDLPTPYHLPCFAEDCYDYFTGRPGPEPYPDLDLIMFHQQQQGEVEMDFTIDGEGNEKEVAVEVEKRVYVASRRSSKKDRHSKITTARGPRDRRMRLSLEVAREFFDLQDMLGFDKASKTVEWLISQSKSAIKEIIGKVKGNGIASSYTSDCKIGFNDSDGGRTVESSSGRKLSKKERKAMQSRRRDRHQSTNSATRESRMKARERARERTLEKMWKRSLEGSNLNNPTKPYSRQHEAGEESRCIQDQTATASSNLEFLTQYEEIAGMAGRIIIDVSSSDHVSGKWSPAAASSSNFNQQDLGIPQSQQLRNCEQFFKQWEAYYNYGFDHS